MGHERVGTLPKSQKWRDIVSLLEGYPREGVEASNISRKVIDNVRKKYRRIQTEPGVVAAFQFLVALSVAGKQKNPSGFLQKHGIDVDRESSRLKLVSEAKKHIDEAVQSGGSREWSELAVRAVADTIAYWHSIYRHQQAEMFDDPEPVLGAWKNASDGSGFCDVAETFFARFTERHLNYFLDREASSAISDLSKREQFQADIRQHADEVARITRSFSAGWYNGNVGEEPPSQKEVSGFLAVAFGKLRDDLSQEGK
jgi:hypothetical protein